MEGKRVLILFEDGERVGRREGVVTAEDAFSITLDNKDVIPRARIVRVELRT